MTARRWSAARYAHPVITGAAAVAVMAVLAVLVWAFVSFRQPGPLPDTHVPAMPVPSIAASPLPVATGSAESARECKRLAAELRDIAREHPVYTKLPAEVAARADQLLSTVGERCGPKVAKKSATDLNAWLTGQPAPEQSPPRTESLKP